MVVRFAGLQQWACVYAALCVIYQPTSSLGNVHIALDILCKHQPDKIREIPWLCTGFVHCTNQRAVLGHCPVGLEFSPVSNRCVYKSDPTSCSSHPLRAIQIFCEENKKILFENPGNCAQYFNCSKGVTSSHAYADECAYPLLFNVDKLYCDDFKRVKCGLRYEPKAPCEYHVGHCTGKFCLPCSETCPSCVGLPDGRNAFPGRERTPWYIVCYRDRTRAVKQCSELSPIFSVDSRKCVGIVDI